MRREKACGCKDVGLLTRSEGRSTRGSRGLARSHTEFGTGDGATPSVPTGERRGSVGVSPAGRGSGENHPHRARPCGSRARLRSCGRCRTAPWSPAAPEASAPRSCARSPRRATTSSSLIARPGRRRRRSPPSCGPAAARVAAQPLDLADRTAVEAFCERLAGETFLGLVHGAGRPYDALAAVMAQDKAEAAMQVNLWSFARLAKALLPGMIRERAGRIVAIGSVAGSRGNPGNAAYAASKGALAAYCRTLAVETARRGITVNVVAPGFVDTAMMAPYAAHRAAMERQIPAGRFARPEEVAALVGFLFTEGAGYITGAILPRGRWPDGDDGGAAVLMPEPNWSKRLLLAGAALGAATAAHAQAQYFRVVGVPPGDVLNIREQPDAAGPARRDRAVPRAAHPRLRLHDRHADGPELVPGQVRRRGRLDERRSTCGRSERRRPASLPAVPEALPVGRLLTASSSAGAPPRPSSRPERSGEPGPPGRGALPDPLPLRKGVLGSRFGLPEDDAGCKSSARHARPSSPRRPRPASRRHRRSSPARPGGGPDPRAGGRAEPHRRLGLSGHGLRQAQAAARRRRRGLGRGRRRRRGRDRLRAQASRS